MKILFTAFEPFGGSQENSAHLAMNLLPDNTSEHILIKKTLPVVYNKSIEKLKSLIDENSPDAVICLGQAAGSHAVRIERLAVNMDDASAPDNEENVHIDKTIKENGDVAYFASVPVRAMMEASTKNGIPAYISYTAGNYVCNHIMYGLLDYIKGSDIIGGFIHVPSAPQQAVGKENHPTMNSGDVAAALLAMMDVI